LVSFTALSAPNARRAISLVVVAVTLAACSGGSNDEDRLAFCRESQRLQAAAPTLAGVDVSDPARLREALSHQRGTVRKLRHIAPDDDDLNGALQRSLDATNRLITALKGVDTRDPDAMAALIDTLQERSDRLQDASQEVANWIVRNCASVTSTTGRGSATTSAG
jgi:hypothetical protein